MGVAGRKGAGRRSVCATAWRSGERGGVAVREGAGHGAGRDAHALGAAAGGGEALTPCGVRMKGGYGGPGRLLVEAGDSRVRGAGEGVRGAAAAADAGASRGSRA